MCCLIPFKPPVQASMTFAHGLLACMSSIKRQSKLNTSMWIHEAFRSPFPDVQAGLALIRHQQTALWYATVTPASCCGSAQHHT